ncbi:hypothetical protein NDU88_010392 [Pleurodeles waltl]|uniref:Uncharacterized protein n=1 Tax=Pleurodeles waltl TaxID=8319 RepID=A0AAV7PY65_PLEWA|nr:hypothetical protein NDU88_010392 [Pleurodeles waltl]
MCVPPPRPVQGHQGTAAAQQCSRTANRPLCNLGHSRVVDAFAPTPTPAPGGAPTGGAVCEAREYWGRPRSLTVKGVAHRTPLRKQLSGPETPPLTEQTTHSRILVRFCEWSKAPSFHKVPAALSKVCFTTLHKSPVSHNLSFETRQPGCLLGSAWTAAQKSEQCNEFTLALM